MLRVLLCVCGKTLDIIESMCKSAGYLLLRLDGQTPTARRMELVERFNSRSSPECELLLILMLHCCVICHTVHDLLNLLHYVHQCAMY